MASDTLLYYGYNLTTITETSDMVRPARAPCVRYSCKLVARDGQTKHNWDVELLPRGGAYAWILADLHTLARHCYSVVSPNKIK